MSDDLISRSALKERIKKRLLNGMIIGWLFSIIDTAPAVDAVEVVHGEWEKTPDGAARCTACKRKMNPSQYGYAFCGLCGAKMDGERKGDDER